MQSLSVTEHKITRVLGLDYGTKRIGVATGQTITHTASPVATLTQVNGSPDWDGIKEQIEQWSPDALIVGIPYHVDGKESDMTQKALNFSAELEQRFSIPVYRINETLSSHAAEEILKKNTKIGKHNKCEVDKIAAAIIVQSWLDQQ
jgi:putative Holliday junction resolvase